MPIALSSNAMMVSVIDHARLTCLEQTLVKPAIPFAMQATRGCALQWGRLLLCKACMLACADEVGHANAYYAMLSPQKYPQLPSQPGT
jgi:hypothetical protein